MELMQALEQYLVDSRYIDALALRQARLISRAVADSALRGEAAVISLLVLAQLGRGSPRAVLASLADQLYIETVESHAAVYHSVNGCPAAWLHRMYEFNAYVNDIVSLFSGDPLRYAPLTGNPPQADDSWPIIVVDNGLAGFSRFWHCAAELENVHLPRLLTEKPQDISDTAVAGALDHVFVQRSVLEGGRLFHHRQIAAAALACKTRFCILSGGPGTGKTSVVLQMLRTLLHAFPDITADRIALCAPTGRAKARLGESIDDGLAVLARNHPDSRNRLDLRDQSLRALHRKTLHSLLGRRPDGTFKYDRTNNLPYEVIVVDEASMVPLSLFSALIDACSSRCRIVLVGDMHQLPPVEAGAVLGDLTEGFSGIPQYASLSQSFGAWITSVTGSIPSDNGETAALTIPDGNYFQKAGRLADHVIILTRSYRSSRTILDFSHHVNLGNPTDALAILTTRQTSNEVTLDTGTGMEPVRRRLTAHLQNRSIVDAYTLVTAQQDTGEIAASLIEATRTLLFTFAILTLSNDGIRGRKAINRLAENLLRERLNVPYEGRFFPGMPLILTANHHDLDLYNGDMGLVVRSGNAGLGTLFPRGKGYRMVGLDRLQEYETAFSLTVHKSQGSEFESVLLVLPEQESPLLNRQIIYTGITRAKHGVGILGSVDILSAAIRRREKREGGLRLD